MTDTTKLKPYKFKPIDDWTQKDHDDYEADADMMSLPLEARPKDFSKMQSKKNKKFMI